MQKLKVTSIVLFIALALNAQFKQETTYTFKKGNGCYMNALWGLSCSCNCHLFDYEMQIWRLGSVQDTNLLNAAIPIEAKWRTCDMPEPIDDPIEGSSFWTVFTDRLDIPDSTERTYHVSRLFDTSYIKPNSIERFGFTYLDGGVSKDAKIIITNGIITCSVAGVVKPNSYVNYYTSDIHLGFLKPITGHYFYLQKIAYKYGKRLLHYHDRPYGYYVLFAREKQNGLVKRLGFFVDPINQIFSLSGKIYTYTNTQISIK
jgi:hypothetical protein